MKEYEVFLRSKIKNYEFDVFQITFPKTKFHEIPNF
jgi:hypothetical protein